MPPSGSASWSSHSSYNNLTQFDGVNKGGIMNNVTSNRSIDDDVIGSLGKALSGVNLVNESGTNVHSSVHGAPAQAESRSGQHFRSQSNQGPATQQSGYGYSSSWGGIPQPVSNAPGSSGLSYGLYGNSNGDPASLKQEPDSLQNILYDSGIYEREEMAKRASTPPHSSLDRERKQSIDIFLSQSPSKALGEDAFRIMPRTASNPSLVSIYPHENVNNAKPHSSTAPSSRSESPHTVRNGGMKQHDGVGFDSHYRQIYPSHGNRPGHSEGDSLGYSNFAHRDGQQFGYGGRVQPPSSGQFSNSSGNIPNGLAGAGQPNGPQQQPQFIPIPVQQQQQQVFYMAVPAPDGKGQVLQPVQMVQLPGQPPTLMVPASIGNMHGQVGSPTSGSQLPGMNSHGSVMLMQTVPSGGTSMYNQDNRNDGNGNSANSQYTPYVNDSQTSGGYDINHYSSSKNGNHDNISGQYQGAHNNAHISEGNLDSAGAPNSSLSMLYSSPHRPPLRALLGNVRRLSRDQVGCRLLQQALDEDGPSAATAILNEGLTFWAEAMVDPFGNYLFQKILERITPEERVVLVKSVSTRLVNASLNLHGTRSVQKIVEVCAADEENEESVNVEEHESKAKNNKKTETAAKILTDALKPSAARLCIDSHGNHAIQRILLKLPYQYTQFIFDAVAASVEDVARHRHGCCVIQRCLDSRHSAARTHLVARIVEKSLELMQDAYGNYVVQYVLDVCGDDEVHAICESVIGKVCLLAIQKFSSNVMEKCLERCTDRVREEYLNELNDSDKIRELMMDPFGNYVVQRALSVSTHAQAIRLVETMKPHLSSQNGGGIRNTAGGRRILGKICRRFPNFVLEGETFEDYDLNQALQRNSPHNHGGRRQNQFPSSHGMPHSGHSPSQRRNRNRNHVPQFQGHHVNVQPDVIPAYHQQAGNNHYMFPRSM